MACKECNLLAPETDGLDPRSERRQEGPSMSKNLGMDCSERDVRGC